MQFFLASDDAGTGAEATTPDAPIDCLSSRGAGAVRTSGKSGKLAPDTILLAAGFSSAIGSSP